MKIKKYIAPLTRKYVVAPIVMVVKGSYDQRINISYDDEEEDPGDPNDARFGHFKSVWDE